MELSYLLYPLAEILGTEAYIVLQLHGFHCRRMAWVGGWFVHQRREPSWDWMVVSILAERNGFPLSLDRGRTNCRMDGFLIVHQSVGRVGSAYSIHRLGTCLRNAGRVGRHTRTIHHLSPAYLYLRVIHLFCLPDFHLLPSTYRLLSVVPYKPIDSARKRGIKSQ